MSKFELPENLKKAATEARRLYYEHHKEKIRESQKKYRDRAKSEEEKVKMREYANKYYNDKIKPVRKSAPSSEEVKERMREYSRERYLKKKQLNAPVVVEEAVKEDVKEDVKEAVEA
jgi:hypothetical protein